MLDDVRESSPPPFEQLKPQIEQFAQQQSVIDYVTALRKAATIEIKKKPVPEAALADPGNSAAAQEAGDTDPTGGEDTATTDDTAGESQP
jgi:peptidyl-prolyl cis-trans isomerase C